jgi:hypothetical protein
VPSAGMSIGPLPRNDRCRVANGFRGETIWSLLLPQVEARDRAVRSIELRRRRFTGPNDDPNRAYSHAASSSVRVRRQTGTLSTRSISGHAPLAGRSRLSPWCRPTGDGRHTIETVRAGVSYK